MLLKRFGLVGAALLIVVLSLVVSDPSSAEVEAKQRSSWGLATFGESRVIANFSALGWAVEDVNGTVFAGGNFLDVTNGARTERQPYLAAFDAAGGVWKPGFAPEVGGPVLALKESPDGGLFVGGEMGDWNGTQRGALVKIDPATGEVWPGWETRVFGGTSVIRDLSLGPDGWLYAAGTFTTASDNGTPRPVSSVVRMDPLTGDIDWSWLPKTNGRLWGVAASHTESTVYIVGWKDIKAGKQVVGVDSNDADKLTWTGFKMNYPCCQNMYDVETTENGRVFVAGEQHGLYVYNENDNMKVIAAHATSYDSRFQASSVRRGGDYQDLERIGDRVYASCHCWGSHSSRLDGGLVNYSSNLANVEGTHTGLVNAVIAYDVLTGERDQSFNPRMAGDIGGWGVTQASDGCLWVAGGFNAVGQPGNQTAARDLVRLCDPGVVDPGPVVEVPVAPASCSATISGSTVTVNWDEADGAVDYVIYRTVNNGSRSWRGRTSDTSFVDLNRDATLVYSVASRNARRVKSDATECSAEVIIDPVVALEAPANCVATIDGANVDIEWDDADGAVDYVIYRSVDGGQQYWRGRVAVTSFTDSNRDAQLTYYVSSKSADGRRSERVECETGDQGPPPAPAVVDAVVSCTVTDPQADNSVTVSWPAADHPDSVYVVSREVDQGSRFWRGRVDGVSFDDTLRSGDIEYFVEVKVGNIRSAATTCTPEVQAL